jgi:hypothetical protein
VGASAAGRGPRSRLRSEPRPIRAARVDVEHGVGSSDPREHQRHAQQLARKRTRSWRGVTGRMLLRYSTAALSARPGDAGGYRLPCKDGVAGRYGGGQEGSGASRSEISWELRVLCVNRKVYLRREESRVLVDDVLRLEARLPGRTDPFWRSASFA